MTSEMKANKELLVALLPKKSSLETLQSEGWYHIPVENTPNRWREGWRPKTMAFYQGKVFGEEERYKIRYFGDVEKIDVVPRKELFPDDEENQYKAEKPYYKIQLASLKIRYTPIISYRPRRLVFIPTTQEKFEKAEQINDLFDSSPIEDRLWSALKYIHVLAERQWKIIVQKKNYYLDFAIFCRDGKLAIETDGYTYHYDDRNQIDYDTWRQNEIELDGWRFLHYTTKQVKDNWTPYIGQIQKAIEQLGGVEVPENFERKVGEEQGKYIIDGEEPL
jgi:very-short-patch-repair endonuclease